MITPVLASTALLTLLLAVGLFFFIRASTKDRTEVVTLVTERPQESLLEQLQNYFTHRAYRIVTVNAAENRVTYEGVVRPSLFLAIFLTALAAVGILCLALVLSLLFPQWANILPSLVLIAPIAGLFYWQKAGRAEQVSLRVETLAGDNASVQHLITVTAHRDELAELRRALALQPFEKDEG